MVKEKKEIYLTAAGLNLLKEELTVLKLEKRPEVIQQIKEARSLGDLSENAEYHAAREEQAILEKRILEIEYMINNSVIIEEKISDKVKLGSTVVIKYIEDGELETYKIVGSLEADPFKNLISNESPIANAIMNKKVGTVVCVDSPNGKYELEIVEIK
ncbi:MAG: transcription elongation factor GreA [Bacilli bacterium]|jgi:transcription elongation factor GreA|nr:transcription elongation factor GreA [Bacilli bacterium]